MDKEKQELKDILDNIRAIPKTENKEKEFDNVYPFAMKLKELLKVQGKVFEDNFKEMCEDELAFRILRVLGIKDKNEPIRKESIETLQELNFIK